VNSHIKSCTGELSVVGGCNIAASIDAAIAIVYQMTGIDMEKITYAVDNIIADLSGIICDGAKPGRSMKIVTGGDTAMRSAFMAFAGYGISAGGGITGSWDCDLEQSVKEQNGYRDEGKEALGTLPGF
jgi:L-cysteine desulfidase